MVGLRRILVAVASVVGSFATAGVVILTTATPSAALSTCTDNWQGPTTGTTNWNASATDWSSGFPTSSSVACISAAGTYTVELTASASVGTLQVGGATSGTQTVLDDGAGGSIDLTVGATASTVESGGVLTLESGTNGDASLTGSTGSSVSVASGGSLTTEGTADAVQIQVPLTNESGGTVTVGAADTAQNNTTLTTNDGTFTVSSGGAWNVAGSSTFTQAAGTLTVTGAFNENSGTFTQSGGAESGNAVGMTGGTLADSVGSGAFLATGSISLTGTVPSGQTVTADGAGGSMDLSVPGAVTVDGTLTLESGASGDSTATGVGSLTVASGGTLTTEGTADAVQIQVPLTNQSGGTVTVGAADTAQNNTTLTTNDGTFSVSSGGSYNVAGSSTFTQAAGTLTVTGAFSENSGTFTQSGGAESGHAVGMTGGTLADSVGTGAFLATGSISLTGTVPSGQTVTADGAGGSMDLSVPGAVTVDGTMTLESGTSGNASLTGQSGSSVSVASGGSLTTEGTADAVQIQVPLTNESGGTVTVGAANTAQNNTTLTTNDGTFTVSSGGAWNVAGSSTFTQAAGTLTVTGAFNENSGTFTQSGGAESGNAVGMTGGTLADSVGSGAFLATGSISLTGTVPSGQTVTADGAGGSMDLSVPGAVTVDGTLTLESGASGDSTATGVGSLTVASGGTLTTEGAADAVQIQVPLTNQSGGTVTVGAADTAQNNTTLTTNAGLLQVRNGGVLALAASSTLTNTATGTIGVTVNGTANTGDITGPGITLDSGSTLAVTTVGSQPTAGTTFGVIGRSSGDAVSGTFSTLIFGSNAYSVAYSTTGVVLTAENPFTVTPTALAPKVNQPLTNPQVATLGNANDDAGTYSATVDYGDGSGVHAATVNVTGATGTVTGPSHTYAAAGHYTVTTTVANVNGTTITVTEPVTPTGPSISKFSKTSIKQGKKLTTVVSGTGFDASADSPSAWSVSNPGVTVVSAKVGKPSKKHPNPTIKLKLSASKTAALGPFSVTLTQDDGAVTVSSAITVVA